MKIILQLKTILIKILDPLGANYYGYLAAVNGRNGRIFQTGISTFDDNSFDGKEYTKTISGDVNGYFSVGDTVTVKLGNSEKLFYDAWISINLLRSQNQNAIITSSRIVGNIKGCLGYWSGVGGDKKSIVIK